MEPGAAVLNIVVLTAAWKHVGDFWGHKTKVPLPGVGDYNEAVSMTNRERDNMTYLAGSWGFVVFVEGGKALGLR